MAKPDKRICVARIGAAHGVRGEVRLWTFTEDPLSVSRLGTLQTQDGRRTIEIVATRPAKGHLVARLAGVDDRQAAEALTNVNLYVAREQLPPTEDGETFYLADLIGLAAVTQSGEAAGSVTDVLDFGAGNILEITPPDGAPFLLAFSKAAVPAVDIAGGRIVIDPPAEVEARPDDPDEDASAEPATSGSPPVNADDKGNSGA
jgi:16S rRNA processing protein RimM